MIRSFLKRSTSQSLFLPCFGCKLVPMHCSREGHERVRMTFLERERGSGLLTYKCPICGWVHKQYGRLSPTSSQRSKTVSTDDSRVKYSVSRSATVGQRHKKPLSSPAKRPPPKPSYVVVGTLSLVAFVLVVLVGYVVFAKPLFTNYSDGGSRSEPRRDFLRGSGTAEDLASAVPFLEQGCEEGHSDACDDLGWVYHELGKKYVNGTEVAEDFTRAASFFEKSCDRGYASSCGELGFMYLYGEGVASDFLQAANFYKKGCNGGYSYSCAELARMYADGIGVAKDPDRAAELYQTACNSGVYDSKHCR